MALLHCCTTLHILGKNTSIFAYNMSENKMPHEVTIKCVPLQENGTSTLRCNQRPYISHCIYMTENLTIFLYTYRIDNKQVFIECLLAVMNLLCSNISSPHTKGFPFSEQSKCWNLKNKEKMSTNKGKCSQSIQGC